jgi:hypothetical protein
VELEKQMKAGRFSRLRNILLAALLVWISPFAANARELLVLSLGTKSVVRYDAKTGQPLSGFGSFLDFPEGITFGPDGNVYVSSAFSGSPSSAPFDDTVVRFNGQTGEFINVLSPNVPAGSVGRSV